MEADVVAVVDDDNIPLEGWGEDLLVGKEVEVNYYETDLPAFDPVGATNHSAALASRISATAHRRARLQPQVAQTVHVDVQADFWNGDPDIDAICRMEHAPKCSSTRTYFPIASNRMAPFNSQNTFIAEWVLKDYFLYRHLSGGWMTSGQPTMFRPRAIASSSLRHRFSKSATFTTLCAI